MRKNGISWGCVDFVEQWTWWIVFCMKKMFILVIVELAVDFCGIENHWRRGRSLDPKFGVQLLSWAILRRMSKQVRCRMFLQICRRLLIINFVVVANCKCWCSASTWVVFEFILNYTRKVECHKRVVSAHLLCINSFCYSRRLCQGKIAYCSNRRVRFSMRSDANESFKMILSFKNENRAWPNEPVSPEFGQARRLRTVCMTLYRHKSLSCFLSHVCCCQHEWISVSAWKPFFLSVIVSSQHEWSWLLCAWSNRF